MLGRRPRRRLADLVRSTVVLHLDGGESLAGVLLAEYDDVVALARVRVLSERMGAAVPVDGEVLIPRDRIRWCQAGIRLDDARELALAPAEGSRGA